MYEKHCMSLYNSVFLHILATEQITIKLRINWRQLHLSIRARGTSGTVPSLYSAGKKTETLNGLMIQRAAPLLGINEVSWGISCLVNPNLEPME